MKIISLILFNLCVFFNAVSLFSDENKQVKYAIILSNVIMTAWLWIITCEIL